MPMKPEMSGELRSMVRDVLREVMASRTSSSHAAVETVRITSDQELSTFVARILEPATLDRLKSGKLRFTLGPTITPTADTSSEVLTGVITEVKLDKLKGNGTLVLSSGAVLTPLARDKARRLGLKIERRR